MAELGFRIIDADNHYYEPDDCFTRHMERAYTDKAVNIRREGDGYGMVFIGDDRLRYFSATPSDVTGQPGALQAYFKGQSGTGDPLLSKGSVAAADIPESQDKTARLALMDEQGVEAALLFPSLAIGVEHELRHDVPALFANLRSFNRWLEEDWGLGTDGRSIGVPLLSLLDIDLCVAELDRLIEAGTRTVNLNPGPLPGRSPADPLHDPFWARCEEAGISVLFHLGNSGLTEFYSALWGEKPNPPFHRLTPFQRLTTFTDRTMTDTMAALVLHDLFGRFPNLTIASIEHGCDWVAPLLKKMDRAARMAGPNDWTFGALTERPSEIFKRHVKVNPFPEEKIGPLAGLIGIENVLGGSDWPHPEGTITPADLADNMTELTENELRSVLRDNTARLLKL